MLTVLELLEAERTDEALALLERLREEVPLKLYDEIPYDKLNLMPLGVAGAASRFEECWWGLVESTPAASPLRERLNKLTFWLLDLHAIRGNRFGLCGGTAAVELNLARSTINHLRKLLADHDAERTAARQALSGAGIPEWEPSPPAADVDELGRSLRAAGKMLSLTERIVRLVVERDTAQGKGRVALAYDLFQQGDGTLLQDILCEAGVIISAQPQPGAGCDPNGGPAFPAWNPKQHVVEGLNQPDITREFTQLRLGQAFDDICSIDCSEFPIVVFTMWRIHGDASGPILHAFSEGIQAEVGDTRLADMLIRFGHTPERTLILCNAVGWFTPCVLPRCNYSFVDLFRPVGYKVVPPSGDESRPRNPRLNHALKLHNELLSAGRIFASRRCTQLADNHESEKRHEPGSRVKKTRYPKPSLIHTAIAMSWWAIGHQGEPGAETTSKTPEGAA